jgi:hypothetical protein
VLRVDRDLFCQLKNLWLLRKGLVVGQRPDSNERRRLIDPSEELRPGSGLKRDTRDSTGNFKMDPGASIASIMHWIIQQADMPADRGAAARSAKVGFRSDCVLLIAEIVSQVRQQLDQDNSQIRRAGFLPLGNDLGHAVQHELAETGVILCQIGDIQLGFSRRRTGDGLAAIEITFASYFERELNAGKNRIKVLWRTALVVRIHQAQRVRSKVPGFFHMHNQNFWIARRGCADLFLYVRDDNIGNSLAALDADVGCRQLSRLEWMQEVHQQRALAHIFRIRGIVHNLQKVDSIKDSLVLQDASAAVIAAGVDHGCGLLRVNCATCCCWVCRTT